MINAVAYKIESNGRSVGLCKAMAAGIAKSGDRCTILDPRSYYTGPQHDVAIFYGMGGNLKQVMADYRKAGKPTVYMDLGYWGRTEGGARSGYHKCAINARHPTAYFQNQPHRNDRFEKFGIKVRDWQRKGRHILLAGFSAKHAQFEGYQVHEWERSTILLIQQHTDRPIIYRPKPSDRFARQLAGVEYSPPEQSLADVLADCHAVVTSHSNVGVDALLEGVPVFTIEGVASTMGLNRFDLLESPVYPDGRKQWAADIAYCQFNVREMSMGIPWRHFKREGLI